MKKFRIFIIIAISAIFATACSKESEPTDFATFMTGSWNVDLEKSYESYTENDIVEMQYVSEWATQLTFTLDGDSTFTYHSVVGGIDDEWNDRYHINGDTLVWDVRAYIITKVNNNKAIIESSLVDNRTTAGGVEFQTVATKHYELNRK